MKKCLTKFLFSAFFVVVLVATSMAQMKITGTVIDGEYNEPLIGATVQVKGTTVGTVTDISGVYNITANTGDILVFSYTGFDSKEMTVGSDATINITMTAGSVLDEVVVVGYGTVRKSNTTGAVSSVNSEDFNSGVIASPEQLIQGRAAGVQITSASGEPGAGVNIRIRGTSSVRNGNNPLFVVDGVPLGGGGSIEGQETGIGAAAARNPLNFLNPNDIENITILKDASETAIYGSRGANGVVIITTKKGKAGQSTLSYDFTLGLGTLANKYDLLSADEFVNAWQTFNPGVDPIAINFGGNTDWQDELFRTSVTHTHNVTFGGGTEAGNYRFSLGYQDQEGIIQQSGLERLTARFNGDRKFLDDRLKISTSITVSNVEDQFVPISENAGFEGDLIGAIIKFNPTIPVNASDLSEEARERLASTVGDIAQLSNTEPNPLALLEFSRSFANTIRGLGSVTAEYKFTDDFSFTTQAGLDRTSGSRRDAFSSDLFAGAAIQGRGRLYTQELQNNNVSWENYLTYDADLSESINLNLVGGYSYLSFETETSGFEMTNFRTADLDQMINNFSSIDASTGNSVVPINSSSFKDELNSFYGRAAVAIQNKYIFRASLRADGSTRFGSGNRYGYFPAIAAKWKIADEGFLGDSFDELSIRANWGITGNQEFGHNLFTARQRFGNWDIDSGGNVTGGGLADVAFATPDLKWESTTQFGAGIDFSIGSGRLNGSFDVYFKNTNDLLIRINSAQPAVNPFVWTNLDADVINNGFELGLDYYLLNKKDFSWNVAINASYNFNTVKNLGGLIIDTGAINGQGLTGAFAQRIAEDQPLYAFFLRDFAGFSEDGSTQKYVNDEDVQQFVGASPLPKWNGGITNNISYKDFSLSIFLTGQFGHFVYSNTGNAFFTAGSIAGGRNVTSDVIGNGEARTNSPDVSTRFLEKADFVRLQNVTLSYSVAPAVKYISNIRFFVTGQNLALFTNYSGQDPEVNTNKQIDGVPSFGIDYTPYPRARTFIFGASFGF